MAALTETEIFDLLRSTLRKAAEDCENLANFPAQGPTYLRMLGHLETIENCSRQAGFWRSDMRWMAFGYEMSRFEARIGDCIRSHHARSIFKRLADMIRGALREADRLQNARTGRRGMILPVAGEASLRQGRPVQVKTPTGVVWT